MKISNEAITLAAKFEGFYSKAYKDPVGVVTIGYGTTKYENGKAVKMGDTITKAKAQTLLEKQLQEHANTIQTYVKISLTQKQYDALASFQYNLGKHILKESKLLSYINAKQWDKTATEMLKYNKGNGKVLPGLVKRRQAEAELFLEGSKQLKKYTSLVDYLKANNKASDFTSRRKLAEKYGIKNYTGTANENTKLLTLLQG